MDLEEQAAQMAEQKAQGWTLKQIAAHHDVSLTTVTRRLNPAVPRRGKKSKKPKAAQTYGPRLSNASDTATIWREWVEGKSQYEIAAERGVDQSSISERLRRFRRNLPEPERETILRRELDLLDKVRGPLIELIIGPPPPAYSNGRAMKDADGNPVPDWPVIISAVTGVLRTQERMAKFLGLDAPAKAEVDVSVQVTEAQRAEAAAAAAFLAGEGEVPLSVEADTVEVGD